ncbi:MAG TPA: GDSL-type esterase/lipase family protein [Chloroflexota bacterium]|nr:GDSL-type esterase/lipase family protein [Chloroflexota bacterium]
MLHLRCTWVIPCLLLLIISLAANGGLLLVARQQYQVVNGVRLDPLNLDYFPATPPEQTEGMTAVFFGDSRAAQWPAPDDLADIHFINRGIGGQTSAQIVARFDAHIRPLQPDILIVQMCINDLKTVAIFPNYQEQIIASCQHNINQVVQEATAMGATVILTTVFPIGEFPWHRRLVWSPAIDTAVTATNSHIHSLAAENVIILDAYALLADKSERLQTQYATDELHLNPVGYELLNQELTKILDGQSHH